ncbi:hypothetical protein BO79DRAFT_137944 [Aspergillus costaricaensis CBS 115574]|uniref:Uncharacterized protein n=1 Tax=Aspergillus costaricaensis CBS 115574 TaxID=1448317 RepID=A0ACD1IS41_9EURO|nr:hypothetical protein BO79DRAFT_137944 [Aspergillus costaricaensis CBS 115574]RAK93262.1 hypothetical protein BO79DRAFT_137944 [Aspergillus costaricaensis CBS 115574]
MASSTSFTGHPNSYIPRRPYAQLPSYRSTPSNAETVTIPRSEYDRLLQDSQHFAKLRTSLLNGGLSQETLDVLIYGAAQQPSHQTSRENSSQSPAKSHAAFENKAPGCHEHLDVKVHDPEEIDVGEDEDEDEDALLDSHDSEDKDDFDESSRSAGSSPTPSAQRTVLIRNLPDRITHRDIVAAMRGGALLHIYLRTREHMASVSFVEEAAAREFFRTAKTYGLIVAGKRVEVGWNDRQFYLPPYVRAKIDNGASRNLVLYNVQPNVTEWVIRKDLDHIHNLIVISVQFKNGNAYISTNSVHNALFARSCMMSRFTYKGMKIGFYPDECLGTSGKYPKKEPQAPAKKTGSVPNRFQLLSLDGADDEDDHTSHDGLGRMNNGMRWADNSVTA